MDIKEKLKSLVKVPSNLTSGELGQTFRPQLNSTINNLFNHNNHSQESRSSLNDLNKNALTPETIKYIQEKHLPIVVQYTKQKELRELLVNPYLTNPRLEEEIINSIEPIYHSDVNEDDGQYDVELEKQQIEDSIENQLSNDQQNQPDKQAPFDPFEHILNKLPDTMDLGFILEEKKKLNKQLLVVTKRVSDLIQQNQSAYNNELASVIELQEILNDAIATCSSGRCKLDLAKKNLTYPNLNIISTYRRREIMMSLLKEFFTIKTLLQTELTLNDLILEDEDYTNAIRLCLECLKIISTLNRYKCVTDLGAKLNYTIEITEERLDQALAKLCINFNNQQFQKIKDTFNLLDKTQFLYDQLLIHFSTAINDKAFNIVNSYVELCANLNDSFNNFNSSKNSSIKEPDFEEVCSKLSSECFLACLIDFNKSMWHIMVNYKRLLHLHKSDLDLSNEDSQCEMDCNQTLIKQKLKYGLSKIWQEIESKLVILIRNHNLSIYSFDDFISMINVVRKITSIGCEFSGAKKSESLEETLRKATSEYFYFYHKTKMEEIKVFLETELWQLVPMKPEFSIEHLHEFSFLIDKEKFLSSNGVDKEEELNYFNLDEIETRSQTTPFDKFMKSSKNNKKDELFDAAKLDEEHHSEQQVNESKRPVVITNSSLNIMRIVGKYIQIMYIFDQISFDVLLCIFHLFDYYLYGVYKFFGGEELDRQLVPTIKPNLASLIKRIESTLIIDESYSIKNDNRIKLHSPELSNMVNLNDKEYLFSLLERAIGVESLVFLSDQFKKIYNPLLNLISEKDKTWLDQFFSQSIDVSIELREPVYMHVASKYLQHDQIIQLMEKVNWEVREIMSQHNLYVDQLMSDLQLFRLKETDLLQFCCKLSEESSQLLWTQLLKLANYIFIEGFSSAKKCTPEGRALMSLDYTTYLCKIENLVAIKPIPNRELVDEYIKAYYYTEDQLENLIKTKREFTAKQLKSLINCTLNDNKKGRQRLLALIDTEYISNR